MAKVQFIDSDADVILTNLVTYYEGLTGRKLQPGQSERLVLNGIAYRISLKMIEANEAANLCLMSFSRGIALEYIGEKVGVKRLPAYAAECTIRFTLVAGHGSLTMPIGLRVQSIDGQAVFETIESKSVSSSPLTVDIKARCTVEGVVGNDYDPGEISIILDPQPYVSGASNLQSTAGGTDDETDEELKERIRLAPSSFSSAGPVGAYKSFARRAHPAIVDIAVTIGHDEENEIIPGQVDIFPLLDGDQVLTDEIRDAVLAECNDEKVRPLTDTVVVKSPTKIDYTLNIEVKLLNDADETAVVGQMRSNLEAYRDARKNKLGIDVVRSQIIGVSQIPLVYGVNVLSPASDIVVNESSFTNCTGITITVVGRFDE